MQEFFTWNSLLTSSGATVATSVVTQLIKEAPLLKKIPTRLLSFGIALCILMLALILTSHCHSARRQSPLLTLLLLHLRQTACLTPYRAEWANRVPDKAEIPNPPNRAFPTLPTIPTAAPLIRMYQMCMSTLRPPPSLLRRHTNFTTAADVAQKAALRVVKTSTVRKIFRILRI